MSGRMRMPALPEGQRWLVADQGMGFIKVHLQEQRPRMLFGGKKWVTIAGCLGYKSGGTDQVRRCVDHILRRHEIARAVAERDEQRRRDAAAMPWGESR